MLSKSRKLWADDSMKRAVEYVSQGGELREASSLYNVPHETLRRRVLQRVEMDCKAGPRTVLTTDEEKNLACYIVEMAGIQSQS